MMNYARILHWQARSFMRYAAWARLVGFYLFYYILFSIDIFFP